ncbi:hypothetical protein ACP4OV_011150 [Aristida adscensionis]
MPRPAAARGKQSSRSSSAIVANSASGRHDLKIDAFTLRDGVGRLQLSSCPFTVGGYRWRIRYYPDGRGAEDAACVSLYLELDEDDAAGADPVLAQFEFSVLVRKRALLVLTSTTELLSTGASVKSFAAGSACWGHRAIARREPLATLVRRHGSDRFTVRCRIIVLNGFRAVGEGEAAAAAPPSPVHMPAPDLHRHLGELLRSGRGADAAFQVGDETFAAHRCVLAARSPVFDAELFGSMKEGRAAAVVQVDDVAAPAFGALLYFVYTNSLPEMRKEEEGAMYQHLLVAADRYGLERLRCICEDQLCKGIDDGTVENILALANQHHCDGLKKACFDFLKAQRIG